jgi:hypothetical protein
MAGRPPGAPNKDKPFRAALMLELKAAGEDMPALREIAKGLITRAQSEDAACREIADRLDGKPAQAIVGSDDHAPIQAEVSIIERVIVEVADRNSPYIHPTSGTC